MVFTAHHIGKPLSQFKLDHHVFVDAHLFIVQHFNLDITRAISDLLREAADFYLGMEFPANNLPVIRKPLLVAPNPATGPRVKDRESVIQLFDEKGVEVAKHDMGGFCCGPPAYLR